jgi:hypothetical protein
MTVLARLKRLLAVRVSDTPGSGSGSMTEGPPTSLHESRPIPNSLVEPKPPRDETRGRD